ncbi:hypothetical protein DEM27_00085 [Metarhizobium album]|uniref:Helix-turn-helix domain-containing protein n=1 Tax=Metarhizobium album TaxID=2182425 RepID=A0A2U2DYT6_9HYPH|nr:helix-turn-helix domain-containing protein [Rhizobium album]PWE58362.1 hypothetical protein DEM27_00085 [Rhizobium album]
MSHDATNWAIKQRGLKPAVKIVLWNLCDRFHPDHGCFPSQETLSDDCEMPRSTLNVYLNELENIGLIRREQRRERGSKRQESTRYRFAFEDGFERKTCEKPSPETGHGNDEAESRNQGEPCPENGESRVQNLDSNPVKEPVIEPVRERERERDDEDRKKIERDFWGLVKDWPGFAGMPKEPAKAPFMRLTADERRMAIERFPAWIAMLKAQKKSHVPAPSTYLQQRLFLDVPDRAADPAAPQLHNAFSKPWMALWLSELCKPMATAFPAPSGFQRMEMRDAERAKAIELERRTKYGWPKAAGMAAEPRPATVPSRIAALAEGFERAHRDSDRYWQWCEMHRRLGLPWFADTGHEWFFFPAGDPESAMANFRAAINEGRDDDAQH